MLEWATLQVKLFSDIHCKDPGLVDKAQTRTQHRETFLYAGTVIYYCDHGYKDVNASHQDSAITLRCSKYGNWSRELPKCESKSLKSWSMIFTNLFSRKASHIVLKQNPCFYHQKGCTTCHWSLQNCSPCTHASVTICCTLLFITDPEKSIWYHYYRNSLPWPWLWQARCKNWHQFHVPVWGERLCWWIQYLFNSSTRFWRSQDITWY